MATNTNTRRQAETTSPKCPTYNVFAVSEKGEDRKDWFEIGAAWAHSDGKGFNITLKALPLPGAQIVLREPKPSESKEQADRAGPSGPALHPLRAASQ